MTEMNRDVLQTGTHVNRVIQQIKNDINSGALKPGDRLVTEAELCERCGVSRGCVREAIKILQSSNIVEIRRGDGTYISDPQKISFMTPFVFKVLLNGTTIEEMQSFRESLELIALQMASANATPEDIHNMKKACTDFEFLIQNNACNPDKSYECDYAFHSLLADAMHNTILRDFYIFSFELFHPAIQSNYERYNTHNEVALYTHQQMVEAIVSHDYTQMAYAVKYQSKTWVKLIKDEQKRSTIQDLFKTPLG